MSTSEKDEKKTASTKKEPDIGRRNFIKYAGVGAAGFAVATVIEFPLLNNQVQQGNQQITELNTKVSQLTSQAQQSQSQIQDLSLQVNMDKGFITLGFDEQVLVEAIAETIIPTDAAGPGAKEAGVIYFIDRQLSGDYGKNANMYMRSPFIMPGQSGPITVDGITYPQGTPPVPYHSGTQYQYSIPLREFWRAGLKATQAYSQSAYGAKLETLGNDQRLQILKDLYDNKPATFNEIRSRDFFGELIFMTWSGFLMDPLYGGNRGMVGWKLVGFNGTNYGQLYGEGLDTKNLMVSNKPVRLQPASLGQWQNLVGLPGGGQGGDT